MGALPDAGRVRGHAMATDQCYVADGLDAVGLVVAVRAHGRADPRFEGALSGRVGPEVLQREMGDVHPDESRACGTRSRRPHTGAELSPACAQVSVETPAGWPRCGTTPANSASGRWVDVGARRVGALLRFHGVAAELVAKRRDHLHRGRIVLPGGEPRVQ